MYPLSEGEDAPKGLIMGAEQRVGELLVRVKIGGELPNWWHQAERLRLL